MLRLTEQIDGSNAHDGECGNSDQDCGRGQNIGDDHGTDG
jgi:hypothetical protein